MIVKSFCDNSVCRVIYVATLNYDVMFNSMLRYNIMLSSMLCSVLCYVQLYVMLSAICYVTMFSLTL